MQNKPLIRINKCECGYDARLRYNPNNLPRTCTSTKALCIHVTFPSQKLIPEGMLSMSPSSPSLYFDKQSNQTNYWATILRLEAQEMALSSASLFPRDQWMASNMYNEAYRLFVYKDCDDDERPTHFNFEDFQTGRTVVLLNPTKEICDTIMINFTNYDNCLVLKSSISNVFHEAELLLKNADTKVTGDLFECHECNLKANNLLACSSCKLARYCSKVI